MTDITIYTNEKGGKYYSYNGINYDIHFPLAWAIANKLEPNSTCNFASGPKNCLNCKAHGTLRGVFVGYCSNCRKYSCEDTLFYGRNPDPIGLGVSSCSYQELVEEFPYMKGANIEQIGIDNYQEEEEEEDEEDK